MITDRRCSEVDEKGQRCARGRFHAPGDHDFCPTREDLAATARQHPLTEYCYHCAPDSMLARGISLHDQGKSWDGPTVHMQTPESFCPRMNDADNG